MCEIFGMSAAIPANVRLSLRELALHGGTTGPHDGWGAVFYEDRDLRRFREAEPASDSLLVRMLEEHNYRSRIAMVHLRKATQGVRALRNTQPFVRELAGRVHAFAHNGSLPGVEARLPLGRFRRVGDTDSEHSFCALMNAMAEVWKLDGSIPSVEARLDVFCEFAAGARPLGPANFIYADGDAPFVHADRRTQATGRVVPPGLHVLTRHCASEGRLPDTTAVGLGEHLPQQEVALIASVPLSTEGWRPLERGEVLVFRDGRVCGRRIDTSAVER